MYCYYSFPIDLVTIGIPIGAKSIGKEYLLSKYVLDQQDSEKTSLCAVEIVSSVCDYINHEQIPTEWDYGTIKLRQISE